jgi:uncharacterized protein (TIGR02284 family)
MRTETAQAITALIIINNNRRTGYGLAAAKTEENDLKKLFIYFSDQSKSFNEELSQFAENGITKKQTTISDRNYLLEDLQALPAGNNTKELLSSSEFAEGAVKRTYDEVMEHTEYLPWEIYEIISSHRTELHKTHNLVRSLYFNF